MVCLVTVTTRPTRTRTTGAWADGDRTPLNHPEQFKQDDDALNVRARIIDVYAQQGFDSIAADDLTGRFRWMGLYTQRKQGLDGTHTGDEDILIAALFHDTLEDVPEAYSAAEMRADYGDRVTDLVLHLSKDDSLSGWQERADAYLAHLEHHAPPEAVLISCADKLHNLMSILDDHAAQGETLWGRFNSGKERQQWWYGEMHRVVGKRLPGLPLNEELAGQVERLRRL